MINKAVMFPVNILLPTAFTKTLSYAASAPLPIGTYVTAPCRGKNLTGIVWDTQTPPPSLHLKPITEILPFPPLSPVFQQFLQRAAAYTCMPASMFLRMAIGNSDLQQPQKRLKSPPPLPDCTFHQCHFSSHQQTAVDALLAASATETFAPFVLDGVTGSGKTEVYLELAAATLKQGKQVLVLLPEIALSTQMLDRFAARFGCKPAVWHSALSPAQRKATWQQVVHGEIRLLVGARSALFLPFKNLGAIIIDEEHDSSYKQEESIIYNARDLAVMRAHLENIPIILASATPSLETVHNIKIGKYTLLSLPERHGEAVLPKVTLVDMRREKLPYGYWISNPLQHAIKQTLKNGEQVLLFLNRRGYAPLTLCRTCGHRWQCPSCSAWLVAHQHGKKLQCHHCGYHTPTPQECPSCGAEDSIIPCGPGIERLAEEAATLFPENKQLLLSSDTMDTPNKAQTLLQQIHSGEPCILIGTQVIAKGYHFPKLTLVGIIDGDTGLTGGDLRAPEKTWALLHQVAGRAGRESSTGQVLLQTHVPEHPVMATLAQQNRTHFLSSQFEEREIANLPPYGQLAAVIISSDTEATVQHLARHLAGTAPAYQNITVLGPAPAPLYRLKGKYRLRFLLKSSQKGVLQRYLQHWLPQSPPKNTKIQIDIDPYSFM